jgi:hypothetical protein
MKTIPCQNIKNLYKEPEFQNSEYAGHQVGPKDSGRHIFSGGA